MVGCIFAGTKDTNPLAALIGIIHVGLEADKTVFLSNTLVSVDHDGYNHFVLTRACWHYEAKGRCWVDVVLRSATR
jgi:hypothetical protein